MTIHEKTAFHRTARWGACALVGAVALTACGEGTSDVATVSGAIPAAAPAAPYVAPEEQDRAAQLAVRGGRASADPFDRRATPSTSGYAAAEASEQSAAEAQASFRLALAAEAARYVELQRDGAADGQTSTPVSADALERWALSEGED